MNPVLSSKVWILIGVVLFGIIFIFWTTDEPGLFRRIESDSGVRLPANLINIDTFDNTEWFAIAHVQLQEKDVQSFIEENRFEPLLATSALLGESSGLDSLSIGLDALTIKNRTPPNDAELLTLTSNNEVSCWRYIIDRVSGRLWIGYSYPDMSGDFACHWSVSKSEGL